MASKRKTYTVKSREQVSAPVKGWVTVTLEDGSTVKARPRDVRVAGEGGIRNRRIGDRRYDCSQYVRHLTTKGGKRVLNTSNAGNATLDNGDSLATRLRGLALDDVYAEASDVLREPKSALQAKYAHLNPGMQRMNLGNRMRAALRDGEEAGE